MIAAILLAGTQIASDPSLNPDSRIITMISDQQHVQMTARFCLRAARQPEGVGSILDRYAARHRLAPAEKDRLIDDCNIALAAAIDVKLGTDKSQ